MSFPESPRVVYEQNPLLEVICQLRFPTILSVQTRVPDEFQEDIRSEYSLYELRNPQADMPPELKQLLERSSSEVHVAKVHDFISADGEWKVSLSQDFIALSTRAYKDWREFVGRLKPVVEALTRRYKPAHITRTGLRYQDLLRPSVLGMSGRPWSDFLGEAIRGEFGDQNLGSAITERMVAFTASLGGQSSCQIKHGILDVEGDSSGTSERCYLIDSDFFSSDRMEIDDVWDQLHEFNILAGRAFRWCISEEVHLALKPQASERSLRDLSSP